jgi:hypothetical protein
MASPFRVFRKYLKPLMVVFGVMIMFSFVLLDPLAKYLGGGGRGPSEDPAREAGATAVSWEGGSLTNAEIYQLVERRRIANEFQRQIESMGRESAIMAGLEPSRLRVEPLVFPEQYMEQSVVQSKLYADAAREAGMDVSDDVIVEYLLDLGRRRVSREDMRAVLSNMQTSGGRPVSISYVFDALREAMLANNYFRTNFYAVRTVSPQQRYRDWLRANDRVVVEAAALPVESYLIEVEEPTEAQLKAFYEEYKNTEPSPVIVQDTELPSANPGFRVPRKIDIQYLQANVDEMIDKTEAEITEEEIAKYYEENKEQFVAADMDLMGDTLDGEAAPGEDQTGDTPATNEAAPPAEGEAPPAEGAATEQGGKAAPADGAEDVPATEAAPKGEASPPPAETTPPAENNDSTTPDEKDQSSRDRANRSVFRQVAFLQDAKEEAPAATDAPATDAAATDAPAESTPPATESAAAPEQPASQPATAGESATPPAEGGEAATPPGGDPTDAATAAPAATESSTEPKKYQPLEEVRDIIRRHLARQRVEEKVGTQMEGLLSDLGGEFNTYFNATLDAEASKAERPAPPAGLTDLAPIAEKNGLTHGKTGPMNVLELRDTPVGSSFNPDNRLELFRRLFAMDDLELYQPVLTIGTGSIFIAMKTSDTPGSVPEFKDISKELTQAWKLREAAKFAQKDAEKQAKAARESGTPLADFFADKPDVQVVKTDPFSELTRGDVPDQFGMPRYRLSQPDGIVAAGPDFMKKVFELKDGEVGVALNHDHSIAYVIRVVEHFDSEEELRTEYLTDAATWDGLPSMTQEYVARAQQMLVADLSGGSLDWKRPPDQIRRNNDE